MFRFTKPALIAGTIAALAVSASASAAPPTLKDLNPRLPRAADALDADPLCWRWVHSSAFEPSVTPSRATSCPHAQ